MEMHETPPRQNISKSILSNFLLQLCNPNISALPDKLPSLKKYQQRWNGENSILAGDDG